MENIVERSTVGLRVNLHKYCIEVVIMTNIHYFYKITNNINGKFYYGVHNTNDENDGYMGSGIAIKNAYEKYGIENFTKEIIKYFETSDEAFEFEKKFVTEELVNDSMCYNMKTGGDGWCNQYIKRNKVVVTDGDSVMQVDKNDERYLSGELVSVVKGMVNVKDKYGNKLKVSTSDERYISGELVSANKGRKLSEEHKKKLSEIAKKRMENPFWKGNRPKLCWVYREVDGVVENKNVKTDLLDSYLKNGWVRGRKTGTLCLAKKEFGSICPVCGNRFSKITGKIYCCKECRDKAEGKDKYPTKNEVLEKYNELKSWKKVADSFGLTVKTIRKIRK